LTVGAGTLLSMADLKAALDAEAELILSLTLVPDNPLPLSGRPTDESSRISGQQETSGHQNRSYERHGDIDRHERC